MTRIQILILTLILPLLATALPADSIAGSAKEDTYRVSLLTCRAGANIYELEGHSALRFTKESTGEDFVVNWGLFDFDAPNFVYRFVKGETDYSVGVAPTKYFLNAYARQGREVVEQELNLSASETEALQALVGENLQPENRVYRYNYVLDNCSTRPLRIIEKAVGDTLTFTGNALKPEVQSTFRNAMRSYHTTYPWYQFGIDLALGSGIDRSITVRETAFAPESLEILMATAVKPDSQPIVSATRSLINADTVPAPLPPTPWWLTPMFWSYVIAAISLLLTISQIKGKSFRGTSITRLFDTLMFGLYGMAGLLLTFLIFVSVHEATSPNWLYLWLNPLCFIGAVAIWVKRAKMLVYSYQIANFALLIALAIIFLCGLQSPNPAFYPLMAADAMRALAYIVNFKYRNNR